MDNDKIIEIETKLAHQEYLLGELNDVLTAQQAQIAGLEGLCKSLMSRLQEVSDSAQSGDDERPPHY